MPLRLALSRRNAVAMMLTAIFSTACLGTTDVPPPGPPSNPATDTFATSLNIHLDSMRKLNNDLYILDLTPGDTGKVAQVGDSLTAEYTLWLANGLKIETNVGGQPFPFHLGAGEVIAGWDQGIVGMAVGGKRRLVIGSNLGFGPNANGPIPPNSTLVFEVHLLSRD